MALTKKDLEDIVKGYKVDLANINTKLDTLLHENAELKKMVTAKDEEIEGLKQHINNLEQHNRAWSVRVMGLPLSPTEEKSSALVRDKLYKNVILPILEGAVAEGDLPQVPKSAETVIEMAHPLRAKDGAIKPSSPASSHGRSGLWSFGTRRPMHRR
jgi:predicted nuclease with TOPRIM domain